MTGTSVGSLNSLMTFVGNGISKAARPEGRADFGSLMAKAEEGQTKTDIGYTHTDTGKKADSDDFVSKVNSTKRKEIENKINDASKGSETKDAVDSAEIQKEVEEAGKDIVSEIAKELNVDEEEVVKAMEVLGLTEMALLDSSNIGKLVLELNGENDPIALATNESIFNSVKELTTTVDATVADLADDMAMEVSDLKELIGELEKVSDSSETEMEMSVDVNSVLEKDSVKDNQKITVTVEHEGRKAEISTDEKGNEVKVISTENSDSKVSEKLSEESHKNENSADKHDSSKEESHEGLDFLKEIPTTNNKIEYSEGVDATQGQQAFVSEQTTEIMDQILEHVKINLKPEMEELELQLHPASLGNVKVNLTNKAGEVTAEFKVQNELVKAAVEAQLHDLRETFRAQGTKVTAIEVSVEMQSFDSNLWQGKGHNTDENPGEGTRKRQRRIDLNSIDELFEEEATEEEKLAAKMMEVNGNTVDYIA